MSLRRSAALCLLLAVTLSAAGCGGSKKVSATAYMQSLCKAIGPFDRDVSARSAAEQTIDAKSQLTAIAAKKRLVVFFQAVADDAAAALKQLKAAGAPDVADGDKVASVVVDRFSLIQQSVQKGADGAKALPTASAAGFRSAARSLSSGVQKSIGSGSSVGQLNSKVLTQAARNAPACKTLNG